MKWPEPEKPSSKPVETIVVHKNNNFSPSKDGIFMDVESASNLWFNINELDAYIEKQEKLIETMRSFYHAK